VKKHLNLGVALELIRIAHNFYPPKICFFQKIKTVSGTSVTQKRFIFFDVLNFIAFSGLYKKSRKEDPSGGLSIQTFFVLVHSLDSGRAPKTEGFFEHFCSDCSNGHDNCSKVCAATNSLTTECIQELLNTFPLGAIFLYPWQKEESN
jgi:hypothetical protein